MMGHTDRQYRWLVRQFCPDILLFTEMLTCRSLLRSPEHRAKLLLSHHRAENPVVLQLAGSDPEEFAACAPVVQEAGFVEINLNLGCPSKRADAGCFGAALMRQPALAAELVQACRESCSLPVTVKTRLGVDELDSDDYLANFIEVIGRAGCRTLYLHARKALLCGISPARNRSIPPLDYGRAQRMRERFGEFEIIVNGGITSWPQARQLLRDFAGVMVGRAAYADMGLLIRANRWLAGTDADPVEPLPLAGFVGNLRHRLDALSNDPRSVRMLMQRLLLLFRSLPGARRIRNQIAVRSRGDVSALLEMLPDLPWEAAGRQLAA